MLRAVRCCWRCRSGLVENPLRLLLWLIGKRCVLGDLAAPLAYTHRATMVRRHWGAWMVATTVLRSRKVMAAATIAGLRPPATMPLGIDGRGTRRRIGGRRSPRRGAAGHQLVNCIKVLRCE